MRLAKKVLEHRCKRVFDYTLNTKINVDLCSMFSSRYLWDKSRLTGYRLILGRQRKVVLVW